MTGDLLVIAQIAGRRCALSALDVKSVIEIGTITPIPRPPAWIAGIKTKYYMTCYEKQYGGR